jgi:hypothetical protein
MDPILDYYTILFSRLIEDLDMSEVTFSFGSWLVQRKSGAVFWPQVCTEKAPFVGSGPLDPSWYIVGSHLLSYFVL